MKNLLEGLARITNLRPAAKSSKKSPTVRRHVGQVEPWKRELSLSAVQPSSFPTHAQVVICGSGLVGNSVAYHLIKHGIKDIVMLRLPGHSQSSEGTVAAQLGRPISRLKSFQEEGVIRESFAFYKSLHDQGHDIGLSTNGGLYLAQREVSFVKIKRRANSLPWSSNLKVEVNLTIGILLLVTDLQNYCRAIGVSVVCVTC